MAETGKSARRRGPTRRAARPLAERIVDETLTVAEEIGWQRVRLRLVAERCGVPLAEVLEHYRDLDAVADGWFRRAWAAMLAPPPTGFATRPAHERLNIVRGRWFDALDPHRHVSAEMIRAKMYPAHPHQWVPLIFNLSRTIHWLRDAAALDAVGFRRQIEEMGLTLLFLATLRVWANDDSEGQEATRAYLQRALACADNAIACLIGCKANITG